MLLAMVEYAEIAGLEMLERLTEDARYVVDASGAVFGQTDEEVFKD